MASVETSGQPAARLLSHAAVATASAGAVWQVVDPWITKWRMPTYVQGDTGDYAAAYTRLNDGFDQRQWFVAALIVVAVVLAAVAMWRAPLRRRRIANGLGVGAVCGLALIALVDLFASGPPETSVSFQVTVATVVALAAAVVAALLTRRAPAGAAPAMSPQTARRATITARLGAVVSVLAVVGATIWFASDRTCGERIAVGVAAAGWVGALGGIAAFVLGVITAILRRWLVGLVLLVAGAGSVVASFLGALSCLE